MLEVFKNYNVKNHSTFKIGGNVKEAAFPSTKQELIELLSTNEYDYVLGNCSNILFSSEYIDKKIIFTERINDFEIDGNTVIVSCGTKGAIVANECKKKALTGFEFLIGFPGSFGGMICMNASAHNQAVSDNFISANVYDSNNKKEITLTKKDMCFSYRESKISKGGYIVLDAVFELKKGIESEINELMNRNIEFRKQRQPSLKYGNAGSTFKNPLNDSAGRLLDLCGLKGQIQGGAMVYEKHANFVINKDNASSIDVIKLMFNMYSKVKEKYTIELKPEIKYIGNEETEEYRLWQIMTENIQQIQK